jgi:hypothetical protein
LPDVLDRFQLGRTGRQEDRHYVVGHFELGHVPSGPVEQQNGTGAVGDVARDFVEVERLANANAAPTPRAGRIALKT